MGAPVSLQLRRIQADLVAWARIQASSQDRFDLVLGDRLGAAVEFALGISACCDAGALQSAISLFRSLNELVDDVVLIAKFAHEGRREEVVQRVDVTDHLELKAKLSKIELVALLGHEEFLTQLHRASDEVAVASPDIARLREEERGDRRRSHWSGLTRVAAGQAAGEMLDGPLAALAGIPRLAPAPPIAKLVYGTTSWHVHPGDCPIAARGSFGLDADGIRHVTLAALSHVHAAFLYLIRTGQVRTTGWAEISPAS